ncbi:MAG: cytochrome d ubiquinol oxidase subunit II [Alphaproteobacteria bacterium]|nr:cytochrome d ubiquinol oxidase subunit II [Alphaproteobacteria bacterium]
MIVDLPLIWAVIIAFAVFMYVFMDGFDLGIGILFPFAPSDSARTRMMSTIAPVWDANETWLVLGGGGLFAAFPLAYAIIMPAVYIPITVMLIALIFRGVAFEFRHSAVASRQWWDRSFHIGSLVATLSQGFVLGAFVQGFEVSGRHFGGGPFDWLTPFSAMTAIALVFGYALLGATWVVLKTTDELRDWAYKLIRWLLLGVVVFIGAVSIWTPFLAPSIADRWFSWPNILYLSPVPLLTGLLFIILLWAVSARRDGVPFVCTLGLFALCYLGLGISLWPWAVPPSLTIWDVAAAPSSQAFMLAGTVVVVPLILMYTAYSYWIFRGKMTGDIGYH